jgi:hypothetical protein
MAYDAFANKIVVANYYFLCDLDIVIVLTCMIPILQVAKGLNKYVQNCENVFWDLKTKHNNNL